MPREAPADFCKEQGRRIPDKARIASVLVDILNQEDKFERDFGHDGVHYFTWRRTYRAIHSHASDMDVAVAYVDAFPGCCEVTKPSYLYPRKIDDNTWDNIFDSPMIRDWVAEVYIWRKLPSHADPRFDERIGRVSSACNDKIRYLEFIHAAIE